MQSEKRGTLQCYFLSCNKKSHIHEQEIEPSIVIPPSLSTPEIQDLSCSSSLTSDQNLSDCFVHDSTSSLNLSSLNENSYGKSIPNDISNSCNDAPVQTKLTNYPVNQQNRSLQSNWFNDRIWLEYSVKNYACYCYYCRHFSSNQLNADDAFTSKGFNNWKKALDKTVGLIKHVSYQAHIVSTKNYLSYKQQQAANSHVLKKLDSCRAIQIRKIRDGYEITGTIQIVLVMGSDLTPTDHF
ncbi:unnamed protein product [Rotaria sp. Silwood2]|nr:unnamed protein product [Rotaria sp. Silwood2]CAF2978055.1 unnamed protein product [Rotaria sp. Silwood2]CAF4291760.1 unnamed protein product [Rotaria sp. Silwood2]CAF4355811.1 unnamed protein product [Rotaria sp. Silwood2]